MHSICSAFYPNYVKDKKKRNQYKQDRNSLVKELQSHETLKQTAKQHRNVAKSMLELGQTNQGIHTQVGNQIHSISQWITYPPPATLANMNAQDTVNFYCLRPETQELTPWEGQTDVGTLRALAQNQEATPLENKIKEEDQRLASKWATSDTLKELNAQIRELTPLHSIRRTWQERQTQAHNKLKQNQQELCQRGEARLEKLRCMFKTIKNQTTTRNSKEASIHF